MEAIFNKDPQEIRRSPDDLNNRKSPGTEMIKYNEEKRPSPACSPDTDINNNCSPTDERYNE